MRMIVVGITVQIAYGCSKSVLRQQGLERASDPTQVQGDGFEYRFWRNFFVEKE